MAMAIYRLRADSRRVRQRLTALCVTGSLVLMAGCSATASQAARSLPTNVPVRPMMSAAMVKLPLYSYTLDFDQQVLVERAVTALVHGCMTGYGLRAAPGLLGGFLIARARVPAIVNWLRSQSAEKYGYHPPATPDEIEALKLLRSTAAAVSGGSPAAKAVLRGQVRHYDGKPVPAAGCLGEAEAKLVGSVGSGSVLGRSAETADTPTSARTPAQVAYGRLMATGDSLVVDLVLAAAKDMEADPRLARTTARWHVCMLHAGFSYATPQGAAEDPRWSATASAASLARTRALQVKVATVDARCEAQVDYAGLRLALLTDYEDRLVNSHSAQLAAYRSGRRLLLAHANLVLDERPRP